MKKIECKYVDIFISKDLFQGLLTEFEFSSDEHNITDGPEQWVCVAINEEEAFKKYIDIYSRLNAMGRVAALYAKEACTVRGELAFLDGKRMKRIQGWIDKHDGKYGCLVILWNNSSDSPYYEIKSKKSLVLMTWGASLWRTMFSPMAKEIINEYTIDYHLKQLRKRVKRKGVNNG